MKKRLLSLALCLCLCAALLPVGVSAESNPYPQYNYDGTVACTWYAWQQAYDRLGVALPSTLGNGGDWYDNAAASGYSTGTSVAANSIACWSAANSPQVGHVAYVTGVNGVDSFDIVEAGSTRYSNSSGIGSRTITRASGYWPDQGFIYLNGSPAPAAVSASFAFGDRFNKGETNAVLSTTLTVGGVSMTAVSRIGVELYTSSGARVGGVDEAAGITSNLSHLEIWYDVNSELHCTLTPGTDYKYKFFAVVNGSTYWSDEWSFKTDGTAPSASNVSVSFAMGDKFSAGETNAALSTRLTLSGAVMTQVSRIGVYLYDAAGTQLARVDEDAGIDRNYNYLDIWYDVNSELHYTLTPGTSYKYKFFAVINGTTYWGDEWSFKTAGNAPVTNYAISLDRSTLTLSVGGSATLYATVSPSGTVVTWTSSNTSIATVSGGKVTAVAAGTATITATAGGKSATCAVTVSPNTVTVTRVTLSQSTLSLKIDESATLTATVTPTNATDKAVTWSSSNTSVATVSAGKVTAVSAGTATITAAAGGKHATCAVTVSAGNIAVTGITLNQTNLSIKVGDSAALTATIAPTNATDKAVTWSTSNASVATVNDGKITAVAIGTATITAKAGDRSATCVVTVTSSALVPQISTTSFSSATVGTAYSRSFSASGTAPITWSVSAGSLPPGLTLSESGLISGTPTTAGSYSFTVTAKNSAGSAAANITLTVTEKPAQQTQPGSSVHFEPVTVYYQDQFTDVPADQWYTDNVADAYALGLMKGDSDTTFNPYGDVTVAEAVTMAARIHSIYTTGGESFDQSVGNVWYQTYLDYALENNIINRAYYNSDVTHKATRAQFAEIFAASLPAEALAAINGISDNAIPDVGMSASYAEYVYLLYRAGILTGSDSNGTFNPQTYITRAESAAIVSRMAESNNRVTFSL